MFEDCKCGKPSEFHASLYNLKTHEQETLDECKECYTKRKEAFHKESPFKRFIIDQHIRRMDGRDYDEWRISETSCDGFNVVQKVVDSRYSMIKFVEERLGIRRT